MLAQPLHFNIKNLVDMSNQSGKQFHCVERPYAQFVRWFALPTEVDGAKVQAGFQDGILDVRLPKSASAKPRSSVIIIT
jgi:HSP20 family protein